MISMWRNQFEIFMVCGICIMALSFSSKISLAFFLMSHTMYATQTMDQEKRFFYGLCYTLVQALAVISVGIYKQKLISQAGAEHITTWEEFADRYEFYTNRGIYLVFEGDLYGKKHQ